MKHTITLFAREVVALAAIILVFFGGQLAVSFIAQGGWLVFGTAYDIADFRHINNLCLLNVVLPARQ
jgi:hypothetical protein